MSQEQIDIIIYIPTDFRNNPHEIPYLLSAMELCACRPLQACHEELWGTVDAFDDSKAGTGS
jgi:hypothetical protein